MTTTDDRMYVTAEMLSEWGAKPQCMNHVFTHGTRTCDNAADVETQVAHTDIGCHPRPIFLCQDHYDERVDQARETLDRSSLSAAVCDKCMRLVTEVEALVAPARSL